MQGLIDRGTCKIVEKMDVLYDAEILSERFLLSLKDEGTENVVDDA